MIALILLSVISLLTVLCYLRITESLNHWKDKGVVHEKPLRFFGNFYNVVTLRESLGTFYTNLYLKYKHKKYIGLYEMKTPVFMAIDPQLIEKVLVKDFGHFVNRSLRSASTNSEVGMMLPLLKDGEWRGVRYKLTPAFSSGKLKNMFPLMINCSNTLLDYLERVRHSDVDMKEASTQFSLDVISNCAFGIDVSKDKHSTSEFRLKGKKIFNLNTVAYYCYLTVLSVPDLAAKLKLSLIPGEVSHYFTKIFKDTFALRKEMKIVRNDFVDLLLQLKEKGSIDVQKKDPEDNYLEMDFKPSFESFVITDKIIISQAFSFLTGGFDGLSAPMVLTVYELARNPSIQERLRKEILENLTDQGQITYDGLKKMTLLENCIQEGLRMYPLNPFLFRTSNKDYKLDDGVIINAGTKIIISVEGLHHDPAYYPEPYKFNPDRFQSKFCHHTSDFTYIPFGAGPRMCIAKRFSLVTIKLGVATIVKDYQVSVSPKSEGPLQFKIKTFFVKSPKKVIYLKLNKLSQNKNMLTVIIGAVLFGGIFILLFILNKKKLTYWERRGIPQLKPLPFIGNIWSVLTCEKGLGQFYEDIYFKAINKKYIGIYELEKPSLLVKDLTLIENILVKDFSYFVNRGIAGVKDDSLIAKGLPQLKDSEWRAVRYKTAPAFSSGKLKFMFETMKSCSERMISFMNGGPDTDVDVQEISTRYALDVIGTCAFGIDVSKDLDENSHFRVMGNQILNLNSVAYYAFLFVNFLPKFASKFGLKMTAGNIGKYFGNLIKDAMQVREKTENKRNDFIDLLLQLKEKGSIEVQSKDPDDSYLKLDDEPTLEKIEMTDEILVSQAFTFLPAGFDGISTPMCCVLYELAKNSAIQEKVRNDIQTQIRKYGGLTYDALKNARYLDCCINGLFYRSLIG